MSANTKLERIKDLENNLIEMCRKVESRLESSMTALLTRDFKLAESIYLSDSIIDDLESEIEQKCLKILLLEHPYAGEFKEVSSVLKLITDLERIGDQSSDICSLIMTFDGKDYIKDLQHIPLMGRIAVSMVKDGVNAYVLKDLELANQVIERDNKVDDLFEVVKKELAGYIKANIENTDQAITFMMIAKYLERIGDHAVNICEWASYTISGKR